jgi:hypothetical protein
MPALSALDLSKKPVKLMLIGTSGAGKTGALTSLVADGYKLRILDMDEGLDALIHLVRAKCPEMMKNVSYMSFRDKYKMGPTGPVVAGAPKAFVNAVNAMDKWEDGSVPSEWGSDYIFVLDSLTLFGRAAFAWAQHMNPLSKEKRQWYGAAQEVVENTIATLTGPSFTANVIVISHIDIREQENGSIKGFASSIGAALGPKLPAYFNTLIISETSGQGTSVKRKLKTMPTALVDAKNPAPLLIDAEYPIETGLATIFKKLKGLA